MPLGEAISEQVEIQVKYQGYIERQNEEIGRRQNLETLRLPENIDYAKVKGLSAEVQQKLNQHRPETVGQAARSLVPVERLERRSRDHAAEIPENRAEAACHLCPPCCSA